MDTAELQFPMACLFRFVHHSMIKSKTIYVPFTLKLIKRLHRHYSFFPVVWMDYTMDVLTHCHHFAYGTNMKALEVSCQLFLNFSLVFLCLCLNATDGFIGLSRNTFTEMSSMPFWLERQENAHDHSSTEFSLSLSIIKLLLLTLFHQIWLRGMVVLCFLLR